MQRLLTGTVLWVAAAGVALAGTPFGGYDFERCSLEGQCRKASDLELALLRGGLSVTTPFGTLDFGIAISREVSVNGQVVAVSQLVLPNIDAIVAAAQAQGAAGAAAATATAQAAAQAATVGAAQAGGSAGASSQGGGSTAQGAATVAQAVSSAGASSPGGGGSTAQGTANAATAAPGASASSASPVLIVVNGVPVSSGNSAPVVVPPGQPLVVQVGNGNVASLPDPRNMLSTILQNSANNQAIQAMTQVIVNSNSLSVLRGIAFSDLVNRAIVGLPR